MTALKTHLALDSTARTYLLREAALILLWAFVIPITGGTTGLINFRLQAASAVLGALILGGWLIVRLARRQRLPRAGFEWAILACLAAQTVAVVFSQDVRRSLPVAAQTWAWVLVFYCAFDLVRRGWPAELIEKTALIAGGIVVGLAWLDLAQNWLRWVALAAGLPFAPAFDYRLYAVFGDANLLAAAVHLLIPFALARALTTAARLPRLALSAWLIAALGIVYFSRSRGGLLGLAAGLGMLAVLWLLCVAPEARGLARRAWSYLRARPIWLIALALIVVLGLGTVGARALRLEGSATQAPAAQARQYFWQAAYDAFAAAPLWGSGPGLYPSDFMRLRSAPPDRPYLHAHSVVFTIAAESGLIGLAGALALIAAAGWRLWSARGAASRAARGRWAAVCAALAGFAIHGLFDNFLRFGAVAVPLIVLSAAALAEADTGEARGFRPAWLVIPGAAVALFTGYSLWAHALSERAADAAAAEDWRASAQTFDQAAAADPRFAFYYAQAGVAFSQLADDEPAALTAAVDRLERAARLEPDYALHHANLAALYAQAGRRADALRSGRRAVELAPEAWLFRLNLGVLLEAGGEAQAAREAYRAALDRGPHLADAVFWSRSDLRAATVAEWRAQLLAAGGAPIDWRRLAQSDLPAAERAARAAWLENPQNVAAYYGLAEIARAQGDERLAARYDEAALWVQTASVEQYVWPMLAWAELAHQAGDEDAALFRYRVAFDWVTQPGLYGWATLGWDPHASFVYLRRGLPDPVAAQVERAALTADLGQRLMPFGQLHEARGEIGQAVVVYRRLLQHDPDLDVARERLGALGGSP